MISVAKISDSHFDHSMGTRLFQPGWRPARQKYVPCFSVAAVHGGKQSGLHHTFERGADMEENKIGRFIRDRRLELGLTQQQLADRLGITDKAVSKWERAVSYPDITILRELAAALEVSVTELLAGERDEAPPVPPEVEGVVVDAMAYAETARKKNGGWRWWTFVALTAGCLIAALVVCIVDGFRFTWSPLILKCLAFGWAVCYPLLRTERPVRNTLVIASVAVYPFLWSLGLRQAVVLGIVIVSVAYAWSVYWLGLKCRSRQTAIFLILLLGWLLHISINTMVHLWGFDGILATMLFTLALDALGLLGAWAAEKLSYRKQ